MHLPDEIQSLLADMDSAATQTHEKTEDKWLLPRSLHPESAHLLALLAKTSQAKRILEIGTSVGYSTLFLALAARETGGHVTTLELMPAKYESAQANLARAGLSQFVTQHQGDALQLLPTLTGPWDVVFLDPEKELYEEAWALFKDSVRPGGLVVADNVLSHAEDLAGYIKTVRQDGRFDSVTVPIGLGLEISYRRLS